MKLSEPNWRNSPHDKKEHLTSIREIFIYGLFFLLTFGFITFRFVVPMITKGLFTIH